MDKKKLNAKDFINIGIFTVIYFVMFFITGMLGYIPIFAVIIPLVLGILGGIPFMLFLTKTGKFGAATIMGTLVSVLCFLMGQSWISIPFGIVLGFLADLIFKAGEYKSWKHTVLGYCELLLSVDSKQSFWIDPRTKLYMLVIFSIVMIDGKTDGISFWLKPILALIPFFLLLSGRRKKIAIIYLIVFIVSWTVNVFLVPYMGLIGTIIISLLAQFGTRWFPSAMMGYYLLSTTKVSEFVLAMQRMHIPEAFIIPFSVMFRFFPTISEEAGSIGNAMRMRGITGKNFFKNPQAVLEYRIVPLMMSVVTIGNDLSAAALTRGLGNGKKRTSICKIGFHWKDFALMIIVTAALLVFLLF